MNLKDKQFTRTKTFTRRLIELDRLLIESLYVKDGYLYCSVKDSFKVFDSGDVDLYYSINEGKQYLLKDVTIRGAESLSERKILSLLQHKTGKPYNPIQIRAGIKPWMMAEKNDQLRALHLQACRSFLNRCLKVGHLDLENVFLASVPGKVGVPEADNSEFVRALLYENAGQERVPERGFQVAVIAGQQGKMASVGQLAERVHAEFELHVSDRQTVVARLDHQIERNLSHGQRSFGGTEKRIAGVEQKNVFGVEVKLTDCLIDQPCDESQPANPFIGPIAELPGKRVDLTSQIRGIKNYQMFGGNAEMIPHDQPQQDGDHQNRHENQVPNKARHLGETMLEEQWRGIPKFFPGMIRVDLKGLGMINTRSSSAMFSHIQPHSATVTRRPLLSAKSCSRRLPKKEGECQGRRGGTT